MATVHDSVLDAAIAVLATANRLSVCSAEPSVVGDVAAVALGAYALTPGVGNGSFTSSDGVVSGRRLTILGQSGNLATGTGLGAYWVLDNGVSVLASATIGTAKDMTAGEPFTTVPFDVELRDPA